MAVGGLHRALTTDRRSEQDAITPHLAAMVTHGGYPSTPGALRHGVSLVVLRLFSSEQRTTPPPPPRAGPGIALDAGSCLHLNETLAQARIDEPVGCGTASRTSRRPQAWH